jgi:hypothetical protein
VKKHSPKNKYFRRGYKLIVRSSNSSILKSSPLSSEYIGYKYLKNLEMAKNIINKALRDQRVDNPFNLDVKYVAKQLARQKL